MTDDDRLHDDPALDGLAQRLESARPVPAAGFRGGLRREILSSPRTLRSRPARLWALVGAAGGSGAGLLLLALAGAAGAGPFAV